MSQSANRICEIVITGSVWSQCGWLEVEHHHTMIYLNAKLEVRNILYTTCFSSDRGTQRLLELSTKHRAIWLQR